MTDSGVSDDRQRVQITYGVDREELRRRGAAGGRARVAQAESPKEFGRQLVLSRWRRPRRGPDTGLEPTA
jgi:hypothetical protein